MERYLCLDIGDKRIGVAVSDPFNSYALPVETYFRKNLKTDLVKIAEYVKARSVTALVCGLPVNFDGSPSIQTEKARFFIEKLKETNPKLRYDLYEGVGHDAWNLAFSEETLDWMLSQRLTLK